MLKEVRYEFESIRKAELEELTVHRLRVRVVDVFVGMKVSESVS